MEPSNSALQHGASTRSRLEWLENARATGLSSGIGQVAAIDAAYIQAPVGLAFDPRLADEAIRQHVEAGTFVPEDNDNDESVGSVPALAQRSVASSSSGGSYGTVGSDNLDWEYLTDETEATAPFFIEAQALEEEGSAFPHLELGSNNVEVGSDKITPYTYLADSGASSHMGPGDEGMTQLEDRQSAIKVGDGKVLESTKVGKRLGVAIQPGGKHIDISLSKYKQVPGLWCNLFSLTTAIKDGWTIGSKGKMITISKDGLTIVFNKIIPSGDGYVCGIDIMPRGESAAATQSSGSSMDINRFHKIFTVVQPRTMLKMLQDSSISRPKGSSKQETLPTWTQLMETIRA